MDDMISRQTAITAIQKAYADTEGGADRCAVWKNVGLTHALHIMQDLPSAQPEHLVEKSDNLVKGLVNDCISRQAAIEAIDAVFPVDPMKSEYAQGIACGAALAKTYVEQLPSAQPEKMQLSTEKMQLSKEDATKGTTFDCISREDAIDVLAYFDEKDPLGHTPQQIIMALPSAQPESRREWYMKGYRDAQPRWIPFKTRALTDEEKEEYPYYMDMLDCQLPKNGQRILVNVKWNGHEAVQMDEYHDDDGSYLDSGYEIGSEATAWMPLPEPYKEEER